MHVCPLSMTELNMDRRRERNIAEPKFELKSFVVRSILPYHKRKPLHCRSKEEALQFSTPVRNSL